MEEREVKVVIGGKVFTILTSESEEVIRAGERLINERWKELAGKLENLDSFSRWLLLSFDLAVDLVKAEKLQENLKLLGNRASEVLERFGERGGD